MVIGNVPDGMLATVDDYFSSVTPLGDSYGTYSNRILAYYVKYETLPAGFPNYVASIIILTYFKHAISSRQNIESFVGNPKVISGW